MLIKKKIFLSESVVYEFRCYSNWCHMVAALLQKSSRLQLPEETVLMDHVNQFAPPQLDYISIQYITIFARSISIFEIYFTVLFHFKKNL